MHLGFLVATFGVIMGYCGAVEGQNSGGGDDDDDDDDDDDYHDCTMLAALSPTASNDRACMPI